ncbi:MATE family efflux transporter [Marinicauda algicola]|uniref:MATE family efflux transporter n=1 Tax=Marinicauda algicola TaxID=2029849 RepID=A0A4S2GYH3_9PROT|nr:MATE family efflux transporter [Marinicauda algicola]TGY88144.1 MATE family efflux transporter [Marinicauda algicola]
MSARLTRPQVLAQAVPIMAANIATPLVGLVDIAVIGRTGATEDIAAVALGTLIFNALFWSLGFLRMGSTALTAQAEGKGEEGEVRATLIRAGALGLAFGLLFIVFQWPLREGALMLFSGGAAVEDEARAYFSARIWGAPAALAGYAVYGWLIGLSRTGMALALQGALNLANAGLSILFVFGLGWGVAGVGAASAIAQWVHLAAAAGIVILVLKPRPPAGPSFLLAAEPVARLLSVNRDIFLRTVALIAGFYWFNEASLREGPAVLAGNAILLQFISISAFFLDAFAHVTEAVAGQAAGRRSWPALMRAFRLTSEQALAFALLLSAVLFVFGEAFIALMTTDPQARGMAARFLPWCALVPLIGMPSWQLDGLMIGTTRGPLMRNAMIAALALYVGLDLLLRPALGGDGLWLAFLGYYLARAATLMAGWPGLRREFQDR